MYRRLQFFLIMHFISWTLSVFSVNSCSLLGSLLPLIYVSVLMSSVFTALRFVTHNIIQIFSGKNFFQVISQINYTIIHSQQNICIISRFKKKKKFYSCCRLPTHWFSLHTYTCTVFRYLKQIYLSIYAMPLSHQISFLHVFFF